MVPYAFYYVYLAYLFARPQIPKRVVLIAFLQLQKEQGVDYGTIILHACPY